MKLAKTFTYPTLERVSLFAIVPCNLQVTSVFGGRAGFDVNTSHVFAQGVLVPITFVGGGAGDRGARARVRCGPGLLGGLHHPVRQDWGPRCWSRSFEGWVQAGSIPSKSALSSFPATAPSPQRGQH